jgi:hypothetical protein
MRIAKRISAIEDRLAAIEADIARAAQAERSRVALDKYWAKLREIGERAGIDYLGRYAGYRPPTAPGGDCTQGPRSIQDRIDEVLRSARECIAARDSGIAAGAVSTSEGHQLAVAPARESQAIAEPGQRLSAASDPLRPRPNPGWLVPSVRPYCMLG